MKYALIVDGVAVEVVSVDPKTIFSAGHADLFMEVPSDVTTGWRLAGTVWAAPVVPEPVEIPPVILPLTRLAMMSRFTDGELGAIYMAAKSDVGVEIWLDRFKMSEEINPADERTISGMQLLVDKGLIEQERLQELLQ